MRRCIAACLVLLMAGAVIAWAPTDPLDALATRVREIPAWHTDYLEPKDDAMYWQARQLEHLVTRLFNVSVTYGQPVIVGAGGTLSAEGIIVDAALKWTARFEVLAHEAGHLFMPPTFRPGSSESEVFAEAVSYLVCGRLGHDNIEVAAHYLAMHKQALDVLIVYRIEIEFAADTLTVRQ